MWSEGFIVQAVQGDGLQKGNNTFSAVSTDSRQNMEGRLFFALKGGRFDGHDFLNQAREQGAKGFVVSDREKSQALLNDKSRSVFLVSDTLKALQDMARAWQAQMRVKTLAVTGSNGKTTTRAFARTLMSRLRPFASPKSYNNPIGLPLSLLQVCRHGAFLIQEIGTNRPGEVAFLTSLCRPVVSAVSTLGASHLEGLGSIELIAQEKKQIYLQSPQAIWLFNRDNPYTEKLFQELSGKASSFLSFSGQKKADVSLRLREEGAQDSVVEGHIGSVPGQSRARFSGSHNVENLMCACAMALGAGLPAKEIWSRIPQCRTPPGRQEWFNIQDKNISVLFDAYNANPLSMKAFLSSCEKFSLAHRRLFALGDMRELGQDSAMYHKELAEHPVLLKSRCIAFMGDYGSVVEERLRHKGFKGRFIKAKSYTETILSTLRGELKSGDFLAIKASRGLRLEKLFSDLTGREISWRENQEF